MKLSPFLNLLPPGYRHSQGSGDCVIQIVAADTKILLIMNKEEYYE